MTRVLSVLRFITRPARVLRGGLAVALLAVAWACADKVVGPAIVEPKGQIGVYADVGASGVTTLVIQVSGPGIVKPDNSPDTLAFNIPLTNGVASGSLAVPAGADRVITARAFVGITESHRGSVTANIAEGTNPTLHITLVPLVGTLPITVSIGSTIVTVRPLLASVAVGDTLRLTSEVRDHNGTIVNEKVRWATLNPIKASVDTNGLVTVKDTGDVQIVGTYGSVGGASKISGTAVASVANIHLTWNGSVNTNWSEPNNWTPHGLGAARVPTLADSVVIPAGAPRWPTLQCVDNNAVRDIVIEPTAQLNSSCYPLNVYGSAVIRGTVSPTVNARPNAKLAGTFNQLYIRGDGVKLIDSVVAAYVSVEIPTGTFTLDQHTLRTVGDFNVSDGTVTMANGDTLIIGGNGYWNGDDQNGMLTGGVVFVRGTQFYGYRYYGTGTSRLLLDRTATGVTQLGGFDFLNSPNNSQIRRLEIKSRDGAQICGHVGVTDTVSIVSTGTPAALSTCGGYHMRVGGPIVTGTNTDVANYLMDLRHPTGTSLVSGTWHPEYSDFYVENASLKPTLSYHNLRFFARNSLPANMAITGHLYLNGTTVELDLNGHKLQVANYFEAQNAANLKMVTAGDSLIVSEYFYMPHDSHLAQRAKLTTGVITIGAYLEGNGFASAGTKVVMTGTSASTSKYINSMNYESRPTQGFSDLEIASGVTYGLLGRVAVLGTLTVRGGATLNSWFSSPILRIDGDMVGEAGSTISPAQVVFNTAVGTSHVDGAYTAPETHFSAPNAVIKPGLAYGSVRILASTQLTGATTLTGFLHISGAGANLKINGQTLAIGNYLYLDNSGTLTMDNASDAVTVAAYANFTNDNSLAHNTRLTAGTLSIGEYLEGAGFSASGSHKVIMAGTHASTSKYINSLNFESRGHQGFQDLEIAGGKTYGLLGRVAVRGTLTVRNGATLNSWFSSPYLRLDGNLVSETGSTISPYNVMLNSAFGTDNVLGAFTPTYTSIHSSVAAGHLQPGLGYQNMQFFAPVSLTAALTVNGELNLNGPATILTLNGQTLTVTGTLNVQNNATLVMQNAADVLDLGGIVNWNGGGSQAGKLTNGTTIFRGPNACVSNYETSGTHKTIFDRAADQVRLQCVSSNGVSQPMWNVDVKGAGVLLEQYMNVTNDIHVFSGATLSTTGGTLWVGRTLTTDVGSTVTNGPSYPSTHRLAVVFEHASGTQNVAGAYSADQSYFTALTAYIQPTLPSNGIDYKYVRVDESTVLQDSTEVDGDMDVINTAILDLNGHTLLVKGSMDLNNTARLRMRHPADTLVVGFGNPAADLIWDAGDNTSDGVNNLLTNGAVKFYGDRFFGSQYKASLPGPAEDQSNHHRFIFLSASSGTVSIEGSPQFANMEIRTPRALVNNSSLTVVKDSLIMAASTTFGGPNQLQILGDLMTASASDLSVTTVYVDGPNGTSLVNGRYRPTNGYFRNASPASNAIKPGLEYNNLIIRAGQYVLTPGGTTTTLAGSLDIDTGGQLRINGQTLNVGGTLHFGTSGGGFVMNDMTDSVNVTGVFQGNGGQVGSALNAGTLVVSGNYNMFVDVAAGPLHKVVMAGSAPKTINSLSGSARALQHLDIIGTGTVNFSSGLLINGNLQVLTPVAVSGGSSTINGNISSVAGSSFTHSTLALDGTSGTSSVNGTISITGTITFLSGSQTIKAGAGYSYANMTIGSSATVTGGALGVPGTLTINSGGSLAVPASSTLGTVNVAGTLNFLSTATATGTLTVQSGGQALMITDLSATSFVDFNRITINTGGTLNNYSDRVAGNGGFRRVGSNYTNSGTLIGPIPASL